MRSQNLEITLCNGAYETIQGCDAMVLVTEWNEFRTLDLQRVKQALRSPVVLDCRNVYEREKMLELGFRYDCFGA